MIGPKDVDKVPEEEWEQFKKDAKKDELYYNGPGDLLDTPEGRSRFCRLNKTSVYRKPDPSYPGYKIWVFNNQGQGLVIKKRSREFIIVLLAVLSHFSSMIFCFF